MNPEQSKVRNVSTTATDDTVVGAGTMDHGTITIHGDTKEGHHQLGKVIGIRQQQQISTFDEDDKKVTLPLHHLFLGENTLSSLGSTKSAGTKAGDEIEPDKPRVASLSFDRDTQLSFPQKVYYVMKTSVAVMLENWRVLMWFSFVFLNSLCAFWIMKHCLMSLDGFRM
jgi:hypothetical protein